MIAVSMRFSGKGRFDKVMSGIDKVIADLHKENDEDLRVKEECEEDRAKNTKVAKNLAYEIDQLTSGIEVGKAEIQEKHAEVVRMQKEKETLELQRAEARDARAQEKAAYTASKGDDTAAAELVGKAA